MSYIEAHLQKPRLDGASAEHIHLDLDQTNINMHAR